MVAGPMSNEVYDALESEDFDLVQGSWALRYAMCAPRPGRWRLGSLTWRRLEALAAGAVRESVAGLGSPQEEVGGGEACQLSGGVQPRAEGVAWVSCCRL